jgi:hypothetical protein
MKKTEKNKEKEEKRNKVETDRATRSGPTATAC